MDEINPESELSRYDRQMRFASMGVDGQKKLRDARVLVIGLGALGSSSAETLTRAGVGFLRIVDRDFLELNNLQRQSLYTEADVAEGLPKAIVAAGRLNQINSNVKIEPVVADVTSSNVSMLCDSIHLIVDGTDNFETRFLINDAAIARGLPWVFGGCLGCDGQSLTIIPGKSACLRCLMPEGPPNAAQMPTCDTAGVLAPIISLIAAIQSLEAIKILSGNLSAVCDKLQVFSLWENRIRQVDVGQLRTTSNCLACVQKEFEWLAGRRGSQPVVLCGRNAVQLSPGGSGDVDLPTIAGRLKRLGPIQLNQFLLKFAVESFEMTLFLDGRAIVGGTQDPVVARRLYAQYFGN
jgi:adenylyltransferase/sulfurtransferase